MQDIVKLVVNGVEFQTFESIEINTSMASLTTDFSFTYTPKYKIINGKYTVLDIIKPQDEVVIYINDVKYLTGYIVNLSSSKSSGGHTIRLNGVDGISYCLLRTYPKPQTYTERNFQNLAERVISENGFSDIIKVQNITGRDLIIEKQEQGITIDEGENIHQFLEKYAKKVQVLLGITSDNTLIIYREGDLGTIKGKFPIQEKAPISLIQSFSTQKTNMIEGSFEHGIFDRYNIVEVYSQNNNNINDVNSVNPTGRAIDTQIKVQNRLRIANDNPTSSTTLEELAKWNVNVRRAQGTYYTCKLQGFSFSPTNKDLWQINTYVDLLDEFDGINGEFLIDGVSFIKDINGTFTNLKIVNKGSYTLDIDKAIKRLNRNNFGRQYQ